MAGLSARPLSAEVASGVRLWFTKSVISLVTIGAVGALSAGTARWGWGWALVAVYFSQLAATAVVLMPRSPDLLAERSRVQPGTKRWDLPLTSMAVSVLPMAALVIAGLDFRRGWSAPMPLWGHLAALAVMLAGYAFTTWAMSVNAFFTSTVRLQPERGQRVISGGPYRMMRHPGYLGAIAFQLGMPFLLGSWWAVIPSVVAAALFVLRTALEDRVLQAELPGYAAYARRVSYRLVPGIW